jgi:WD40 repeat protein
MDKMLQDFINEIDIFNEKYLNYELFKYYKQYLITLNKNKEVKVYNLNSRSLGECILTSNSIEDIIDIFIHNSKVIYSHSDGTVKQLNPSTTLYKHKMTTFILHNKLLILGCCEGLIKVLDFKTYQVIATLKDHKSSIVSLIMHGNKLISKSADGTIHIWDSNKAIHSYKQNSTSNSPLIIHENKLITSNYEGEIIVLDVNDLSLLQIIIRHVKRINCLTIYDGKLISGCDDGEINVWNLEDMSLIQSIIASVGKILNLTIYENKVLSLIHNDPVQGCMYTGSALKVWEFKSSKLVRVDKFVTANRSIELMLDPVTQVIVY